MVQLPSIRLFEAGVDADASADDLYICALGFEPRALAFPRYLGEQGYTARRCVVVEYGTNRDDNERNRNGLLEYLRRISSDILKIEGDQPSLTTELKKVIGALPRSVAAQPPRVALDVSVVSNRLLLRCLKALFESDARLRVLYAEAAVYHPTHAEYMGNPAQWETDNVLGLERGVSDVAVSIEYPGLHLDANPDAILIFPSFKAERSEAVVSCVDPSLLVAPGDKIVWLLGVPHLDNDRWRLEAMRRINRIRSDAPQHEISTFDYKETLRALETLYSRMWDRYSITLSPIGSKMQALGSTLFCYLHPDVRVIFATPKEYNAAQYSEGCKARWIIDLGQTATLRAHLEKVGTLTIED